MLHCSRGQDVSILFFANNILKLFIVGSHAGSESGTLGLDEGEIGELFRFFITVHGSLFHFGILFIRN